MQRGNQVLSVLPKFLFRLFLLSLLPAFTDLINASLSPGYIPADFKSVAIYPLLKQHSMPDDLAGSYKNTAKHPFPSEILGSKAIRFLFLMKRDKIYLNSLNVLKLFKM